MKTTETVERFDVDTPHSAPSAITSQKPVLVKELDAPVVALPMPGPVAETRYRLAATRLEAAIDGRRAGPREAIALGRLVIVTSAQDGDGKTTTALHIATALSQAIGRRVALVEADTERPGLATMLGLGQARGLTEVLAGQASLDDVLLRGADGGPLILPAGGVGERLRRPAALLPVLNALREYHDYVVVDCSAIARAADAAVIGRAADGVLLVVRVGSTSSPSLAAALEALVDTPVVGCLLNDHDGPSRTPPTRGRPAPAPTFNDEE